MAIKFLKGIINFCKDCVLLNKVIQLKAWSEIIFLHYAIAKIIMLLKQHYFLLKCVTLKIEIRYEKYKDNWFQKVSLIYKTIIQKCFYHAKCQKIQVQIMCSQYWIAPESSTDHIFPA